jgi:TonB family protein
MHHGTEGFFVELARNMRRLSSITFALSVLMASVLLALQVPVIRKVVRDRLPPEVLRFGFEGQEQYVRRILLETRVVRARPAPLIPMDAVAVPDRRRGGASSPAHSKSDRAEPEPRPRRIGEGDSEHALLARALRRAGDTPLFQSEELIIEELVRPHYPEAARDRGIEGRVAVMALVDTTGHVVEVDVMDGGIELLGHAAALAVRQCRFRPYRVDGEPREVYAMFRFSFRLD